MWATTIQIRSREVDGIKYFLHVFLLFLLLWSYFTFRDLAGNLGPIISLFGYQPIPLLLYLVFTIVACHLSFPAEDLLVVFWSLGEMAKSKCEM